MSRKVLSALAIGVLFCSGMAMAQQRTPANNIPGGPTVFSPLGGDICDSPNIGPFGGPGNPTSAVDTQNISGQPVVNNLKVQVQMAHTWVGDTVATLTHGADSATLWDRPGLPASVFGCSNDNVDAEFTDAGSGTAETMCNAAPPTIMGNLQPASPLSVFDGDDANGIWTLTINDLYAASASGTLSSWCLGFFPTGGETTGGTATGGTATPATSAGGVLALIATFLGASAFLLRQRRSKLAGDAGATPTHRVPARVRQTCNN